ncbi:MAG: flagellin FliC [Magnetococcales bacterium]|nr:flagellin FliC [Magnetococcales bacterium]NGZ29439.1 flagellin FliC [Magnetococcales bacterium]
MTISISTNIASLNAQRYLSQHNKIIANTFMRLASGLRINSARDDAAGLTITTRLTAQIRGINQAQRNANNTLSLLQVADGALEETTSALQRMRELSVQAANDTYSSADRSTLQQEFSHLATEIQRIATQTHFNRMNLLTGSFDNKSFQIGAFIGQTIRFSIGSASNRALGLIGGQTLDISTYGVQSLAIFTLDNALASISDIRSSMGAMQNRFLSVISNLTNVSENLVAAHSRIMDADIAEESARLIRHSILQRVNLAVLAQANQHPQLALQLLNFS